MIVYSDSILAVIGVIFIVTAIVVAYSAFRYGRSHRIDLNNQQFTNHNVQIVPPTAEDKLVQPASSAVSSSERIETETVLINSQQGRITVSVMAQLSHK